MKKLNSKSYFSSETHNYLDDIMEKLMRNPNNKKWLQHAGTKGGSTAFVFTKAFYATDKKGNTTEYALFFNNLSKTERQELQKNWKTFTLKILKDNDFRSKLQLLNSQN
jgi:D-alanyl-D-alanine carboxypeptidase